MSKCVAVCLIAIFLVSVSVSQDRGDIVYMKDGTVLKGVIVENVPNDYIRMELSGGSLITIKYSDIAKFGRESTSGQRPSQQTSPAIQSPTTPGFQRQAETTSTPQFRKGVYRVSGALLYSSNTQDSPNSEYTNTTFTASPGFATFLTDGLLFGIDANYTHSKFEEKYTYAFSSETNGYDYTSYGVGISLQYYAIVVNPIPFFGAQVSYSRSVKEGYLEYAFDLGLAFPISLNMGIEPFVQYGIVKLDRADDFKSSTITAGVRVAYYIFE